jgi:CheY-like chemotaxis protein
MKVILESYGFEADIAGNGKVAIEKLSQNQSLDTKDQYDIILMDLQMPYMDGFEATSYIRNQLNSLIPVIALTADVTTADAEKCRKAGMNDYISKPVDEKMLYHKILKYIPSPVKFSKKGDNGHVPKTIQKKMRRYTHMGFLNTLTKKDPKMMSEMLNAYLEEIPRLIHKIKQGLDKKDWQVLETGIHAMIPSFSTVGISDEYEQMARKIQKYARNKEEMEKIDELFGKIETVCIQAYKELQDELVLLKKRLK